MYMCVYVCIYAYMLEETERGMTLKMGVAHTRSYVQCVYAFTTDGVTPQF